jgi:hypothetical protein
MATAVKRDDELPEGFALDELPEGFTVDADTGSSEPTIPGRQPQAAPPPLPPSIMDFLTGAPRQGHQQAPGVGALRGAAGAAETGLAFGTGATTGFLGGVLGTANTMGSDVLKLATGRDPSGMSLEQAFMQGAGSATYQPRTTPGQEMTQSAGQFLGTHGPSMIGLPRMPPGALRAGAQGMRDAPGAVIPAPVARAGAAVADAITPSINPEIAKLAKSAREKYGIDLMPHQVAGGRITEKAGQLAESVPLAGSRKDARQAAYNKAVIRQINPEATADKLTGEVFDAALERSGAKINEVASKHPVPLAGKMKSELNSLLLDAQRSGEGDSPRIIPNLIEDFVGKAGDDGLVPGHTLREAISDLGRKARSTQNGDLRNRLNQMQDTLLDSLERVASKEDMDAFKAARKEYAIAKQIEPLVAKMVDGDVPPAALLARVTATKTGKEYVARGMGGDIAELAQIGQLLKEPASSGTAERGLVYQTVRGAAEGGKMAAAYPPSLLYNLLGPEITRRMAEKGRATPVLPPEQPLSTGLGFETVNQGPPLAPPAGSITPAQMALLPEFGTSLGAAAGRSPGRSQGSPGGRVGARTLYPNELGLADQPMRVLPGGYDPRLGADFSTRPRGAAQIPTVPGRPGLPDVMPVESFGQSKSIFADQPTIDAAGTPNAQLARGQQLGQATALQQEMLLALSRELDRLQKAGAPPAAPVAQQPAAAAGKPTVNTPSSLKAEKPAQRANNASGESAASQEAINRVAREKAAGQVRARWSGGKVTQLTGPDAVDQRVGPKDIVLQRGVGKNKWTVLNSGKDVKQSDIARAIAEAEKKGFK